MSIFNRLLSDNPPNLQRRRNDYSGGDGIDDDDDYSGGNYNCDNDNDGDSGDGGDGGD